MSSNASNSSLWIDVLLIVPVLLAWWAQARVRQVYREADRIQNAEEFPLMRLRTSIAKWLI